MHNKYVDQVIESLQSTGFWEAGIKKVNYEEGMEHLISFFLRVRENRGRIFFIGNGGSAAIASHMTADFMKNGNMITYSLYDSAVLTCMGNDYGYEHIFSKPLEFLGERKDLLVAISSSGNSQNILNAVNIALAKGMLVITFTGFNCDNRISRRGHYNIHVPVEHYGIVETIHNLILQQVVDTMLERDGREDETSNIS